MSFDSSVSFGPTLASTPGFLKAAKVGGIPLLFDSGSMNTQQSYRYTNYAFSFPTDVRQKVLHSRGVSETSWQLSGDVSVEGQQIVAFLNPSYRGYQFSVEMQQGPVSEYLNFAYLENISLNGAGDGLVHYSMSGKALDIVHGGGVKLVQNNRWAIPGWSSGNELVKSWTFTHQISLAAHWFNDQNPFPAYYRPGDSEYTLSIQTANVFVAYDTVSIGIGTSAIITGLVTNRAVSYSGRDYRTYECQVTNVSLLDNPVSAGATSVASAIPPSDWLNDS